MCARASMATERPNPAAAVRPKPGSVQRGDATLAEMLGVMSATWRGMAEGGVAKHDPDGHKIIRAMTGYAGGASGGYLIKPEWADEIWDKVRSYDGPASSCLWARTKLAREFWVPAYWETSRADGSRYGGTFGQWRGAGSAEIENLTTIASQPSMAQVQFLVKRLMIFTSPISRDLAQDSSSSTACWIRRCTTNFAIKSRPACSRATA